jgi:hypothetical protein
VGCESHRNKRSGLGQKRETVEGEEEQKNGKKKTTAKKKKNLFFLEKVPCWDSNFEPFPTVPEAALWTIGVA